VTIKLANAVHFELAAGTFMSSRVARPLIIACLLLTTWSVLSCAKAATRQAFVAGVNTYDNLGPDKQLAKAVNDARAVGETLTGLGFTVSRQEDLKRAELNKAWQTFLTRVQPGDMVAVFFSGHGVQVGGINYLLPRDVPKLSSGEDGLLRGESISLQQMLDDLKQRSPGLSLVIIDACRENPFPLPGGKSIGGTRGLARIDPPEGTFVMYSAGAGELALDRLPAPDLEPTSIFTRSLLPLLKTPGLKLQEVALQTREAVRKLASTVRHKQTPAYYDEISGPPVCLAGVCRDVAIEPGLPTQATLPDLPSVPPPVAPVIVPTAKAPLKCDPDEREVNGKCVEKPVAAKKCDSDENLVSGKCVIKPAKVSAAPPKKCDPDENLVNGKCVEFKAATTAESSGSSCLAEARCRQTCMQHKIEYAYNCVQTKCNKLAANCNQ
jgi:hypothetical protein